MKILSRLCIRISMRERYVQMLRFLYSPTKLISIVANVRIIVCVKCCHIKTRVT